MADLDAWRQLRGLSTARIALGRSGTSLTTAAHLSFQFDHAQARDAVHTPLDTGSLTTQLQSAGFEVLEVASRAADRGQYLTRPDLGRRLAAEDASRLAQRAGAGVDICVVLADGLSSRALQSHGPAMAEEIRALCQQQQLTMAPLVIARQGRVALGDEVAEMLNARLVVMLIGERPGLSSPDSLGLYMTYAPRVGLTDAARNCLSNIRLEGLSYRMAAHRLSYLLGEALRRRLSGVALKDETEVPVLEAPQGQRLIL
ncbi:ethanolamine ammonia-lyase subunit EutC [Pseudomonas aeruginosa]